MIEFFLGCWFVGGISWKSESREIVSLGLFFFVELNQANLLGPGLRKLGFISWGEISRLQLLVFPLYTTPNFKYSHIIFRFRIQIVRNLFLSSNTPSNFSNTITSSPNTTRRSVLKFFYTDFCVFHIMFLDSDEVPVAGWMGDRVGVILCGVGDVDIHQGAN